jgi:hypothetical protein
MGGGYDWHSSGKTEIERDGGDGGSSSPPRINTAFPN